VAKTALYVVACVAAALVPLVPAAEGSRAGSPFAGWPAGFEGRALRELPLSEREARFAADFPGRIGRFTDGSREVVIRWVEEPTRKLHPAADCFEGVGYDVRPLPARVDADGAVWGRFEAARGAERVVVRERIFEASGRAGAGSSDVSQWYWTAVLGRTSGPWWAVTVASAVEVDGEVGHPIEETRTLSWSPHGTSQLRTPRKPDEATPQARRRRAGDAVPEIP
jgi:hypothetical protein